MKYLLILILTVGLFSCIKAVDSQPKKRIQERKVTRHSQEKNLIGYDKSQNCRERMWVTREAKTRQAYQDIFYSQIVGEDISYHVTLPPSYHDNRDKEYPIIYWLHGSGASMRGVSYLSKLYYGLMKMGSLKEHIIIFPNGLANSMWIDSADGCTPVESVMIKELIPYINNKYRVKTQSDQTIIEGHSMGGYGALRFGFKYPEIFGKVSAIGPGPLQDDLFKGSEEYIAGIKVRQHVFNTIYGNSSKYYIANSPLELSKNYGRNEDRLTLRIIIGTNDDGYSATKIFHNELLDQKIKHEYIEMQGIGHSPAEIMNEINSSQIKREWLKFYD